VLPAPSNRIEQRSGEQVNLCLVYPGIPRRHPDRWALDVLCTILGGGGSSRLFQRLRDRYGLVYDVQSYSSHYQDTGSIGFAAGTDPTRIDRAVEAILAEIRRIQRTPPALEEVRKAQSYFAGRLWLGLEDSAAVASWFGAQEMLHHEVVEPSEAVALVEHVDAEAVRRIARTYLRPEQARLVAVGPVREGSLQGVLPAA
jgi:predicted Zn-dependent peptidase